MILLTGICKYGFSQDNLLLGTMPVFNLNAGLKNGYKFNAKLETRQIIFEEESKFHQELVDLATMVSKKTNFNTMLAIGGLIRYRNEEWFYRLIQQYTIVQEVNSNRLSHRFRTDQTFNNSRDIEWRLRYRLSSIFPLTGEEVNNQEYYFKLNNEYVYSMQGSSHDLEIRIIPTIGFRYSDKNKLELGLDNRFDSFIESKLNITSWVCINWYISL